VSRPSRPTGPPPDWTAEQIAEASVREIDAGRLPLQAQWRLNTQRQDAAFTSDLTVGEHAALRSVGFSPVGQALGSAVYNVGWNYTGCGYWRGGGLLGGYRQAQVVDLPLVRQLLWNARERAIKRMRQECAGLGGDGVVAVRLAVRPFYGNGLEFTAIGTAVRADGSQHMTKRPFTSDLSGQDFAKLLRAGWLPVALVLGVGAVLRHDDWVTYRQSTSWMNQEMTGHTELVTAVRAQARDGLTTDAARHGGSTVVLRDTSLRLYEVQCRQYGTGNSEARDHVAEATMFGTAIVPLPDHHRRAAEPPPLAMLRLDKDPDRRKRARANQEGKA
jgi:uncharacterized protein YbjQ (UPF0145 family)